ncbi:MAG: hydrogenase maturation nickel metallochaperone HypA [Bacilli bacterium]|jgi:hydrogenase nickel incorporation protein HypA/HybF
MHELGIVFYVIDAVEEMAKKNKAKEVVSLTLEIGEVSSVIPSYFKECYDWAIKKTKYMKNCKLNMVIIEGISYCKNCKKTFSTTKYGKTCPNCKSDDTYLVTGDDVVIRNIGIG